MKRFYSIQLSERNENVPAYVAKLLLKKESPLIQYLDDNNALRYRHLKKQNILECYGDERHLIIGKMKYPDLFGRKGRMGFMELYISMKIKQQMAKESVLGKLLRREVEVGANGTQQYVIKNGPNAGKVAVKDSFQ